MKLSWIFMGSMAFMLLCDLPSRALEVGNSGSPDGPDQSGTPGLTPQQISVCNAYNRYLTEIQNVPASQPLGSNALAHEDSQANYQEHIRAIRKVRFQEIKSALSGDGTFHDWIGVVFVGNIQNLNEEVQSAVIGKRIARLHDTHMLFVCPGERHLKIGFGMSVSDPRSIALDSPLAQSMRPLNDGGLARASGKMDCQTEGCIPDQSPFTIPTIGDMSLYFVARFSSFSTVDTGQSIGPKVFDAPSETMEKLLVKRVPPVYPLEAKRLNLSGTIRLTILINLDGTVASVDPSQEEPAILRDAAIEAVRQWRYQPPMLNDSPTMVRTNVLVEFAGSTKQIGSSPVSNLSGPVSTLDRANGLLINLEECTQRQNSVICKMKITRVQNMRGILNMDLPYWRTFLIDNGNLSHQQINSYVLDHNGMRQKLLPLGSGETATLVQEFSGTAPPASLVRISFTKQKYELTAKLSY